MAALAAGLALLALPAAAQAQDRGHGRWGGGDGVAQGDGGDNGGWHRGNGGEHGFRSEQSAPTPAPAPQVQARKQPQRNWSRGDGNGWNGDGDRGRFMRGRGANPAEAAPATPAPQAIERRNWQGNGGASQWQGRNPSYVDPNRNRTYRDPNRDSAGSRGTVSRWHYDNNGWRNNDSWRGDRQAYGSSRSWSRDWRGDSRYDWRGYRDSHRSVYRLGPYFAPYGGYSYRRLGVGFYLDGLFFGSDYWIDDPWSYRLPPAYGPYRWIRYYDDSLLVDIYSGEVVDVIYDFFW
jgi:hypothetical protein